MRFALLLILGLLASAAAGATYADAASVVGQPSTCIRRLSTAGTNQAGLSVTFGDGRTQTFCIEFGEDTITGAELLRRSGLSVVTATTGGLGAAVCSIGGVGCNDPGDCFCKCRGGTCQYWAYYRFNGGGWQYSPVGPGSRIIHNDDADAWVWGGGGSSPPNTGAICADPAPSPSAAAAPTASATPRPSATPARQGAPPTATVPPPQANTSVPMPPPVEAGAAASAPPTSAVLSEVRTPPPAPPTTVTTPGSSTTADTSTTPTPNTVTGVIRVSDSEGERNLAGQASGGSWRWRNMIVFGAVGATLLAAGGALVWRRRAGI